MTSAGVTRRASGDGLLDAERTGNQALAGDRIAPFAEDHCAVAAGEPGEGDGPAIFHEPAGIGLRRRLRTRRIVQTHHAALRRRGGERSRRAHEDQRARRFGQCGDMIAALLAQQSAHFLLAGCWVHRNDSGDGTTMGRLPGNPPTPQRQVGTICTGPRSGQGQPPWIIYSLRDVLRHVPGSTRRCTCRPSRLRPQVAPRDFPDVRQWRRAGRARRQEPAVVRAGVAGQAARRLAFRLVQVVGQQQGGEQQHAAFGLAGDSPIAASLPSIIRPSPATWLSSPSAQATVKLRPPIIRLTLLMPVRRRKSRRVRAARARPRRAGASAVAAVRGQPRAVSRRRLRCAPVRHRSGPVPIV